MHGLPDGPVGQAAKKIASPYVVKIAMSGNCPGCRRTLCTGETLCFNCQRMKNYGLSRDPMPGGGPHVSSKEQA